MVSVQTENLLEGLLLIKPVRHRDERGYFEESYNREVFSEAGISCDFVQDNHAYSQSVGVLRGLHFQSPPRAQDKLVRCTQGRIFDVAVDIRKGSETYGKHVGIELSAENGFQLYVPKGFAHGYCALESHCEVQYKVSDYYSAHHEQGIAPKDAQLGIKWPFSDVTMSDKDMQLPSMREFNSPFKYSGTT